MKVREVIKMIEDDGWEMLPRKGTNHRQFKHKIKPGRVTISGNPGDELGAGALNNILKQARLKGKRP